MHGKFWNMYPAWNDGTWLRPGVESNKLLGSILMFALRPSCRHDTSGRLCEQRSLVDLGEFCYRWLCLLFMLDSYHFSLLISLSLSTVDRWYSDTDRNLPRQSQQGRSADESTGRNKDSWRLSPPTWTRFRSMGIRDRSPWGKFIFHHIFAPHGVSC